MRKKRKGFTLAEALITLAIIGAITALVLPAVNKIRPDEKKVMYLKAYDALSKAVMDIAGNRNLYPNEFSLNNNGTNYIVDTTNLPLYNINNPDPNDPLRNENWQGLGKFGYLVAHAMNVPDDQVTRLNDTPDECKDVQQGDNCHLRFRTSNGIVWETEGRIVRPFVENDHEENLSYNIMVLLRLRRVGVNDLPCIASDVRILAIPITGVTLCNGGSSNRNASTFRFIITADGRVIIADELGLMYQETRNNLMNNMNVPSEAQKQTIQRIAEDINEAYKMNIDQSQLKTNIDFAFKPAGYVLNEEDNSYSVTKPKGIHYKNDKGCPSSN